MPGYSLIFLSKKPKKTAVDDAMGIRFLKQFSLRPISTCASKYFNNDAARSKTSAVSTVNHVSRAPAPINLLPVELLSKIFFSTLFNPSDDYGDGGLGYQTPRHPSRLSFSPGSSSDPMILAQVCSHWRGVSLSVPLLWSSIHVLCTGEKRNPIPLLSTWLDRSGSCPLTICIVETSIPNMEPRAHGRHESRQNPGLNDILSLLVTQVHRWKLIKFRFSSLPPVVATLSAGSLKILETTTVLSRNMPIAHEGDILPLDQVWSVIDTSPLFYSPLDLEYLEKSWLSIPWVQLTSIDVTISDESLLEILSLCRNLVDISYTDPMVFYNFSFFSAQLHASVTSVPRKRLTLPHLRNLSLTLQQSPDFIFDQLTLPSLESFEIRQYSLEDYNRDFRSLSDLLTRSECRLRKLLYEDHDSSGEPFLLEILQSALMSSLVDLIVESPVTDEFIKLLTRCGKVLEVPTQRDEINRANYLPRLSHLILKTCNTEAGTLQAMAFSRSYVTVDLSLLRYLQINHWFKHKADLEGLRILAKQGMKIST